MLQPKERRSLIGVFSLILVGTVLETISVGMMIPVLTVIASNSKKIKLLFFTFEPTIDKSSLIQIAVGTILLVYVIKIGRVHV